MLNQVDGVALALVAIVALFVRVLWDNKPAIIKAVVLFVGLHMALAFREQDYRRDVLNNPLEAQRQLCWWRVVLIFRPEDDAKRGAAFVAFLAAEGSTIVCYLSHRLCTWVPKAMTPFVWLGAFTVVAFFQLIIFLSVEDVTGAREQPQVPAPAPSTEATPLLAARQQRAPPAPVPAHPSTPPTHTEAKVDGDGNGEPCKGAAAGFPAKPVPKP